MIVASLGSQSGTALGCYPSLMQVRVLSQTLAGTLGNLEVPTGLINWSELWSIETPGGLMPFDGSSPSVPMMAERKFTRDPTDVSDGLAALRGYERSANSNTKIETCKCGALVRMPANRELTDEDRERGICMDCDNALGKKLYWAFAKPYA